MMPALLALVAFLVAVLSGLGVGSAGLLVVFMTTAMQMPQLTAQGLNLLFYLFSAGASLFVHVRRRNLRGKLILLLALSGIAGSYFGASLAPTLDPTLLRRLFGGMLILSGSIILLRREKKASVRKS